MYESEESLRQLIAENIAYYRKQNGDTQADLAEKLNYSDKSVSKWERAEGTPDIFILTRIADLYHISVQDLLRQKKVPKAGTRRLIINLLSVGLVWLVMTTLFCLSKILNILSPWAWMLFIYALPMTGIVCQVFSALWWGRIAQVLSCSLILWGVGLSIVLSLQMEGVFLLFIICGVLEVLLILFYLLRHLRRKNTQ